MYATLLKMLVLLMLLMLLILANLEVGEALECSSLRNLYIKNLKVNLNISWSPINYEFY